MNERYILTNVASRDFLWGNDEARYYKFRGLVDGSPAVLKVQFHQNMRKRQSLDTEVSNLKMVDQFIGGGLVEFEGVMYISFLVISFPGKMENELRLHYNAKLLLQKRAIQKYREIYKMVNTYVLAFFAGDIY